MIRSSIDLGTNTCLMLVMEDERVLDDLATVVRLGQEVDKTRRLHPDAMKRTMDCLEAYSNRLKMLGGDPKDTYCVSTASARDADGASVFFDQVRLKTGFSFQVISGKKEAQLSFKGALLPGMDPNLSIVIDIGGGSTEFTSVGDQVSTDLGSVRFTERYLMSNPVTDQEFWDAQNKIDEVLQSVRGWMDGAKVEPQRSSLIGVAGTVTTVASWQLGESDFDEKKLDNLELTKGDVHRCVEELKWRTIEERKKLTGVEEARADVLLAGAMILWRSMEVLGYGSLRVSTRGLRYGLLLEVLS